MIIQLLILIGYYLEQEKIKRYVKNNWLALILKNLKKLIKQLILQKDRNYNKKIWKNCKFTRRRITIIFWKKEIDKETKLIKKKDEIKEVKIETKKDWIQMDKKKN